MLARTVALAIVNLATWRWRPQVGDWFAYLFPYAALDIGLALSFGRCSWGRPTSWSRFEAKRQDAREVTAVASHSSPQKKTMPSDRLLLLVTFVRRTSCYLMLPHALCSSPFGLLRDGRHRRRSRAWRTWRSRPTTTATSPYSSAGCRASPSGGRTLCFNTSW